MAEGVVAAFDPILMTDVAPQVGDTPTFILLGKPTAMFPRCLMGRYHQSFQNAKLVDLGFSVANSRPHLHPLDTPRAVVEAIATQMNSMDPR